MGHKSVHTEILLDSNAISSWRKRPPADFYMVILSETAQNINDCWVCVKVLCHRWSIPLEKNMRKILKQRNQSYLPGCCCDKELMSRLYKLNRCGCCNSLCNIQLWKKRVWIWKKKVFYTMKQAPDLDAVSIGSLGVQRTKMLRRSSPGTCNAHACNVM